MKCSTAKQFNETSDASNIETSPLKHQMYTWLSLYCYDFIRNNDNNSNKDDNNSANHIDNDNGNDDNGNDMINMMKK